MDIQAELIQKGINPNPLKDQFFLLDESVIHQMIAWADVGKDDVVLEVGAGNGALTRQLAAKAKKVIAFEIDSRFKPFLIDMPHNVELHFDDAWDFVQLHGKSRKAREFNKVVANLPYSFVEPLLHNLTFLDYDKAVLLIPQKLADKINTAPVFGSFFTSEQKVVVDKHQFYPVPRTNSVVIELHHKSNPIETHNLALFLRQYMYQHERQKAGNSLREGLIVYWQLVKHEQLTKNQAKAILTEKHIPQSLLQLPPDNAEIYELVSRVFNQPTSDTIGT